MNDRYRVYDRGYDRGYPHSPPAPPAPPPPGRAPADWYDGQRLVPVTWRGLDLDPGHVTEWFTAVVENVTGWYDSAPLNGNSAERALADGGFYGLKVIEPREVTVTGAAVGPRVDIMGWRDRIAGLCAERQPSELAVTDPWLGLTRTAMVRADSGRLDHVFLGGRRGFRYQFTVTAADPILYGSTWKTARLTTVSAAESGRPYDRLYAHPRDPHPGTLNGWQYGLPHPPQSSALLVNDGDAPAPVFAVWDGDLSASIVTDNTDSVNMAALGAGEQVALDTVTLVAEAPGGANRSGMVQPGSRPMTVPAFSSVLWHLYAVGSGSVTLTWRDAWL